MSTQRSPVNPPPNKASRAVGQTKKDADQSTATKVVIQPPKLSAPDQAAAAPAKPVDSIAGLFVYMEQQFLNFNQNFVNLDGKVDTSISKVDELASTVAAVSSLSLIHI